jgi:hypothetical protein
MPIVSELRIEGTDGDLHDTNSGRPVFRRAQGSDFPSELVRRGRDGTGGVVEKPVVQRSLVLELEGAERVARLFDGVALAVREVIAQVDVSGRAGARTAGVENTVDDGLAQVEVR